MLPQHGARRGSLCTAPPQEACGARARTCYAPTASPEVPGRCLRATCRRRCAVQLACRRAPGGCRASAQNAPLLHEPESWEAVFEEAEEAAAAARTPLEPASTRTSSNRVFLVGVALKEHARSAGPRLSIEDSLDELAHLSETAGLDVVGRTHQTLAAPDRRTYIGSGKLAEIIEQARALDVDTLIFDYELRPSQARNIERAGEAGGTPIRVCDRVALILDIFRQRAATREGWLQTQLARIEYQLPRLTRLWTHLERQSGGGGLAAKGMGESQLEIDKRLLRVQAARIREKLERYDGALARTPRASRILTRPFARQCSHASRRAPHTTRCCTASGHRALRLHERREK